MAGVSYDRMLQALQTSTAPETLAVCPIVRGLVVDSLFPTLDRIAELEKAGGVQPGVGETALPPGVLSPGEGLGGGGGGGRGGGGRERGVFMLVHMLRVFCQLRIPPVLFRRQLQHLGAQYLVRFFLYDYVETGCVFYFDFASVHTSRYHC